ncbi:hypothetical protein N7510_000792 [Penicillium lagena]|uniref:uncharacterized protein n=1 Tax=Penicillium lagena TaxID=94218 RepID=UPI00253FAFF2|nr:uncharacterized protein N7510_000792 [Penicillium lagena]KAJ5624483.1 hypothetical protein N7510_000792 [Penicillium lagena]
MSTSKASAEATAVSAPANRSFGSRAKTHYKKWWWVHLIVIIIVLLVVLLPVVYVGYPKIAQTDVNESTLNITSMVISDPTPDSFHLTQTQVIGSHASFHPQIFAFSASVSLLGAAAPFASVQVPAVQSKDGAVVDISQTLSLSDVSAFGDYAKAVMLNEEVDLNIYGKPVLQEGALPKTTVTYNKTVTMKGLNKLKGFNVTEFNILGTQPDGTNMNGTVLIPNPSVLTLAMGNLTLDLSVAGQPMGQSYLKNLVLKPGNNTIPMTSKVDDAAIIKLLEGGNKYSSGIIPFDITGNSSVYNGQNLPYFTAALAANTLTVELNVGKALGLSSGTSSS